MTNLATDTTAAADDASALFAWQRSGLSTDDLHRIAGAIDAEVAPSLRATYGVRLAELGDLVPTTRMPSSPTSPSAPRPA